MQFYEKMPVVILNTKVCNESQPSAVDGPEKGRGAAPRAWRAWELVSTVFTKRMIPELRTTGWEYRKEEKDGMQVNNDLNEPVNERFAYTWIPSIRKNKVKVVLI